MPLPLAFEKLKKAQAAASAASDIAAKREAEYRESKRSSLYRKLCAAYTPYNNTDIKQYLGNYHITIAKKPKDKALSFIVNGVPYIVFQVVTNTRYCRCEGPCDCGVDRDESVRYTVYDDMGNETPMYVPGTFEAELEDADKIAKVVDDLLHSYPFYGAKKQFEKGKKK
jgi:hypothetical protein